MVKKKRQNGPGEQGDESTESCDENVMSSCPHIKKSTDLNKLKKALKPNGFSTECFDCTKNPGVTDPDFETDLSLWMCLQCGTQLCGRTKNKHALMHYEKPHSDSHALTINTTIWVIYCYCCSSEVSSARSKKLPEILDYLKKQQSSSSNNSKTVNIKDKSEEDQESVSQKVTINEIHTTVSCSLPLSRVRGLSNQGNTCFFNSVVQCLVQTPYLSSVLQEMAAAGEKFELPGGKLKMTITSEEDDGKPKEREVELPAIQGELEEWGSFTESLAETLKDLQKPGQFDVYNPRKLFNRLIIKTPQFAGGDQHDSHELLRHLLEGVRSDDLRRYQAVVLQKLGLNSKERRSEIDDEMKQKVKFYGQQASDTMLRPEQVFRGFLVSTLECQECNHTSNRTEYFLDLSLPVAAHKPQPPAIARRKGPMQDDQPNSSGATDEKQSKHQWKKEKQATRKLKKSKKGISNGEKRGDSNLNVEVDVAQHDGNSSSEQSDADVEDNLEENSGGRDGIARRPRPDPVANFPTYHMESGYNSEKIVSSDSVRTSPVDPDGEKVDASSEAGVPPPYAHLNASIIPLPYRPLGIPDSPPPSNPDSGVASPDAPPRSTDCGGRPGSPASLSGEIEPSVSGVPFVEPNADVRSRLDGLGLHDSGEVGAACLLPPVAEPDLSIPTLGPVGPEPESPDWRREISPFGDRLTAASPRQGEGEYSVESCLNQFTASELMAGSNKVSCEACTRRAGGKETCYTNATKRFLISSPPAVLILHLKRFQIGIRSMCRKMTKHVEFSTLLDLAPYCSDKVKTLPSVRPGQTRLLYSLYGVVEHSGGMHSGHYVAYVKVRPDTSPDDRRRGFLPTGGNSGGDDTDSQPSESPPNGVPEVDGSLSGYESGDGAIGGSDADPPPGKWFHVSDSRVQEISEERVLKAQAYLLFYERIV